MAKESDAKHRKEEKRICYLDAAATCLAVPKVLDSMMLWMNRGNPSSDYASAKEAQKMMESFREYIASLCGFKLDGPEAFSVVFTSGASESNNFIVTSAVRSFAFKTGTLPHVITSAVEHSSLLECCRGLAREKLAHLTILPVGKTGKYLGAVDPDDLRRALRPNTCLVSIMAANNETGVINDLRALAGITKRHKVPFHTDAVQLFGKEPLRPLELAVDAFSVSFHKLGGPVGTGVLVLREDLIKGYGLCPLICGAQNKGLRGGTEPVHNIAGSFTATKIAMEDRDTKNARMGRLREAAKKAISSQVPACYLDDYRAPSESVAAAIERADAGGPPVVVWISPTDWGRVLPSMLFLSVHRPRFCNRAARAALEARGVIVSVGSACHSASVEPSGVVKAIDLPTALRDGVLRVSLGDDTTADDIKAFVRNFLEVISSEEALRVEHNPGEHSRERAEHGRKQKR